MTPTFHAGLDWSGKPELSARPDTFIACFVAVSDPDELRLRFNALRQEARGGAVDELHGHKMTPPYLAVALSIGLELEMSVGALCIDKRLSAQTGKWTQEKTLYEATALKLWPDFLERTPVAHLVHDADIEGKARPKAFATDLKRLTQPLGMHGLKVKPLPSQKSDLIQLADVVAYTLSRQINKQKVEAEILELWEEIRGAKRNVVRGPEIWG